MRNLILAACALALAIALSVFGTAYGLRLGAMFAMYATLALAWNVIGGFAGYPSFATAAFFGLGAYTGAILQAKGVFMPLAWVAGGVMAGLFAAAFGSAILHLKGHYFAIASLISAEVLLEVATSWTSLTGGGAGLNLPVVRMSVQAQAQMFYWAMLVMATLTLIMNAWVSHGRIGFALRCIRQNEDAASMVGVNTTLYKTISFVLSAIPAGAVGAVYASWVFYIEPPDVFSVLTSVKPIVIAMLGGAGTIFGPVIGAAAFLFMEELVWRNFLSVHAMVLGLLIVLLVFFLPRGLTGLGVAWPALFGLKPRSRAPAAIAVTPDLSAPAGHSAPDTLRAVPAQQEGHGHGHS